LSATELHSFLSGKEERYLAIYFSEEPFNNIPMQTASDGKGILIEQDVWRRNPVFMLSGPFMVVSSGLFYQMDFCSEYLDKDGNIVPKSASFCAVVQEFQKYSKKLLKK
jgi:hypothetical protein